MTAIGRTGSGPGTSLIFCNSCGAVSIDTPRFGWKRYRHKDIDITVCHHCPSCQEYNGWLAGGLIMGRDPNDAVTYENWETVT
jgi:hypothetical protein